MKDSPLVTPQIGSRCIYCLSEFSDGRLRSLEHIVQASIGGSTVFGTRDCCKPCNDRLGAKIDAPFVDCPPISFLRVTHDLRGQSGTVPTYRFSGTAVEETVDAEILMAPRQLVPRIKPSVRKSHSGNIETTKISGSAEQVRHILQGQIEAARAKGQKLVGPDGKVLENVEMALAQAHATPLRTFSFQIDYNPVAYELGLLKIAYGAAYFFQGPEWLDTPTAAELRRFLDHPDNATPEALEQRMRSADARVLEIFAGDVGEIEHVIFACFLAGKLRIGISLFSQPNRDFVMIDLGEPVRIPTAHSATVGVVITPKTRAARWITINSAYREVAKRLLGLHFDLQQIEEDVRRGVEPSIRSLRD